MTREEALQILDTIPTIGEQVDALELAIKALEQEPCNNCDYKEWLKSEIEQEPCEDCISRAEAINAISHAELSFQVESDLNFENYKREVQEIADGILKGQVKAISNLPSVQPKPKTDVLDKIRAEIHATAEMHEDGDYYLRDEWIDEIIDKYKAESEE